MGATTVGSTGPTVRASRLGCMGTTTGRRNLDRRLDEEAQFGK